MVMSYNFQIALVLVPVYTCLTLKIPHAATSLGTEDMEVDATEVAIYCCNAHDFVMLNDQYKHAVLMYRLRQYDIEIEIQSENCMHLTF